MCSYLLRSDDLPSIFSLPLLSEVIFSILKEGGGGKLFIAHGYQTTQADSGVLQMTSALLLILVVNS